MFLVDVLQKAPVFRGFLYNLVGRISDSQPCEHSIFLPVLQKSFPLRAALGG